MYQGGGETGAGCEDRGGGDKERERGRQFMVHGVGSLLLRGGGGACSIVKQEEKKVTPTGL